MLAAEDILYIIANAKYSGGSRIDGIVEGRLFGTRQVEMTAAQLTTALVSDGLSRSIVDVRLLVCWGEYKGDTIDWKEGKETHKLKRKGGEGPFAGQLCSALKTSAFSRLRVTGYAGTVGYSGKIGGAPVTTLNVTMQENFGSTVRGNIGDKQTLIKTKNRDNTTTGSLSNYTQTVWY